jgi:vancomycin resistance protein YoaR
MARQADGRRRQVAAPRVAQAGQRSGRGEGVSPLQIVAALLVLAVVAGVATLIAFELWVGDRVVPGVYVWDVDLSGLTREEATARVAEFRYPTDRWVTLHYGNQTWSVDPGAMGTYLDVPTTVEAAFAVGHGQGLAARLGEQARTLLSSRLVLPVFEFNVGSGTIFTSRVAREVNTPLRNASLKLGDDLRVEVIVGQAGREVDVEATRLALVDRISAMTGGEVLLAVQESQPLLMDVSVAQAQVERILSGPVTLAGPDGGSWTIEPKTLAGWLILRPVAGADGQYSLAVSLDPGQSARLAQEIAGQVDRPPQDARFRFDDASGSLAAVADSVDGRTVDVTATVAVIEGAATGDAASGRNVELPVLTVRPQLATEDGPSLGIVELLGEGVTSYAGSTAAREQNITVGTAQFDGLLIAPDETFSFNDYLGEVTKEKGYEEGIIIWGNTTKADVGGGLCQVSSTAFRAAFWAGLPVVERTAHSFRVSYYEPPKGLDATIYSPYVDLKWTNDTGHYILIQTYVDHEAKKVSFRYYGTNPGRTVEMEGPVEASPVPHGPAVYRDDPTLPKGEKKQIEWAKDGLDVTVYRIIKENGVEVRRDTFFSRYLPWQAVYLVGTKE